MQGRELSFPGFHYRQKISAVHRVVGITLAAHTQWLENREWQRLSDAAVVARFPAHYAFIPQPEE